MSTTPQRPLAPLERIALRTAQQALEDTSAAAWLSPDHKAARRALAREVARLADDGVPLSELGAAMGVSKQRAHRLAAVGREGNPGVPQPREPEQ